MVLRERVVGRAATAGVEEAAGLPVLRHRSEAVVLLLLAPVLGHHGREGRRSPGQREGKRRGGEWRGVSVIWSGWFEIGRAHV